MIRILWICNIMLPVIARQCMLPYSNREGWLSGIFERLENAPAPREIELGICFPVHDRKGMNDITVSGFPCYGFYENLNTPERYDSTLEQRFKEIYDDFKPDMIHIFGTEFPHALAAAKSFQRSERTLVGIQGLCSEIEKVYMAGLPKEAYEKVTFRDWVKKDSLKQQQQKFRLRSEKEKQLLGLAGHITGRTCFDKEATQAINPKAVYHGMNETMRNEFYTGGWEQEQCEECSVFLGQGDYPLKGFHYMLEAMPLILQKYPDTTLYVGGNSIIRSRTWKEKLKLSGYGKYLISLINKYNLEKCVKDIGNMSAQEMKDRFLRSQVFVCPSILENSPNMVAEAMLLGVPVAASFTGGIPDMLTDGKEGLLFPAGNAAKLAEAVIKLMANKTDTEERKHLLHLSEAARKRAAVTHDGEANYRRLLSIYREITSEA